MNCEGKKNLFSGFFNALAIQLNQRTFFVLKDFYIVNFLKK